MVSDLSEIWIAEIAPGALAIGQNCDADFNLVRDAGVTSCGSAEFGKCFDSFRVTLYIIWHTQSLSPLPI